MNASNAANAAHDATSDATGTVTGAGPTVAVTSRDGTPLHVEVHEVHEARGVHGARRADGPPDAPTVVLVHGWTCQVRFWYPLLPRLTGDHRVVLYDQRGHGRTPATPGRCTAETLADDLCAVLAATTPPSGGEGGRRTVVVGHSMGAMAVVAAAARPELRERADAVVLCSTTTDRPADHPAARSWRAVLRRRAMGLPLPFRPVTPLTRRLVHRVLLAPDADPELVGWTARLVSACPPGVRAEWGRMLAGLDVLDHLPHLTLPVTLVHGTVDRLTPPRHAHRTAGRLPRPPELVELPGIGHMTPLEAPDAVVAAIRAQTRPTGRPTGRATP
ncbi:alpha/beta fold hydrolase [Streptomyces sp. 4N509B]|uniref:alpha/beta fold hydrolase n=1 Tax=Streptomyces sp. 4N509B TaxID=3457413 RepID=UPI003FD12692